MQGWSSARYRSYPSSHPMLLWLQLGAPVLPLVLSLKGALLGAVGGLIGGISGFSKPLSVKHAGRAGLRLKLERARPGELLAGVGLGGVPPYGCRLWRAPLARVASFSTFLHTKRWRMIIAKIAPKGKIT